MRTVSICTIVKDEGRYLAEWIEFHLLMGVKYFYIYDNDSTDDTFDVLKHYEYLGIVKRIHWPGVSRQPDMCSDFVKTCKRSYQWVAFIDIDEFLVIPGGRIALELERYSAYGGVVVNWRLFGSNGHIKSPSGLVVHEYTKGAKDLNRHVKTILNMSYAVDRGKDVHSFRSSRPVVDQHYNIQPIDYALMKNEPLEGAIELFHYHTKSLEDYTFKCSRNRADIPQKRDLEKDFPAHDINEVERLDAFYVGQKVYTILKNRRNELGE